MTATIETENTYWKVNIIPPTVRMMMEFRDDTKAEGVSGENVDAMIELFTKCVHIGETEADKQLRNRDWWLDREMKVITEVSKTLANYMGLDEIPQNPT